MVFQYEIEIFKFVLNSDIINIKNLKDNILFRGINRLVMH